MINDEQINYESRLTALEAYAKSVEEGLDVGLETIATSTDPEIVRRRLGLLLANDRVPDAADLVRNAEPHSRWCDTAITILLRNGDVEAADRYLEWAQALGNSTTRTRCRVMYANESFVQAFKNRTPGEPVLPGDLSGDERQRLERVIDVLSPVLPVIEAQQAVAHGRRAL